MLRQLPCGDSAWPIYQIGMTLKDENMITEDYKPLPQSLEIPCYACERNTASHVRRLKIGEMTVQVCLCAQCMRIDTQRLLNHTIGIAETAEVCALRNAIDKM